MDPVGAVLIVVCCWLIGGGLLAVVVPQFLSWRRIMRAGVPVTGTVTKVEDDSEGDPWVTIEYHVGAKTHELRLYRGPGQPGEAVSLLVDPARPERALVKASAGRRGALLLFVLLLAVSACLCGTVPIVLALSGQ